MKNRIGIWTVGAVTSLLMFPSVGDAADPEFRAAWVSRFEWPSQNRVTAQNNIRNIMQTLRNHNFNAVFFQIRGQCDVLYPSPYEPWGQPFGWTDPGWDPLQFAIDEARANGLEFHAYINTHTLAQNIPPANTVPQHRYNINGPTAEESWVIHDSDGNVEPFTDAYAWIAPGVPQAEAWTRRAIMHVVENYDIDGIHLDRIRTPGAQYSHDPISVARFQGAGNPAGEEWGDWMRSQISRQLRRLYGAVNEVNPDIKMSAAPFGIAHRVPGGYQGFGTESHYVWYQDSFGWMQNRLLDFLVPQIYWDIGSAHPFEVLLADFMDRDGGRHIYPGSVTTRDVIGQVYEARNQGSLGQTVFSFNSAPFSDYLAGPYNAPAEIPVMPWKENPETAIIVGNVTTVSGDPLLDVVVSREGDSYPYLTSYDGFYAILEIEPGEVTLTATMEGLRPSTRSTTVSAGDVVRMDFQLLSPSGEIQFDEDPVLVGGDANVTISGEALLEETELEVTFNRQEGGDPVTVMVPVSETAGVFHGSVPVRRVAGEPVPGVLHANDGDTIVATFLDVVDGQDPVPISATASVAWNRFLIDNDTPGFSFTGDWLLSTFGANYGPNKRYIGPGDGSAVATWDFEDIPPGLYGVEFWVNDNNYAEDAQYVIDVPGGPGLQAFGNQNYVGDGWNELAEVAAPLGRLVVNLSDSWTGSGIYVVADAIRLTLLDPMGEELNSSQWMVY